MKPYLVSCGGKPVSRRPVNWTIVEEKIKFPCPHCGKNLTVPTKALGKRGKCKNCGNGVIVPGFPSEPNTEKTKKTSYASLHPETTPNQSNAEKQTVPVAEDDEKKLPERELSTSVNTNFNMGEADIWQYFRYYIQNVLPKGSPTGITLKYIGFWWRCFGVLIDFLPIAGLLLLFDFSIKRFLGIETGTLWEHSRFIYFFGSAFFIFHVLIFSVMEATILQGSFGKWVLDFKVVDTYGAPPSLKRLLLRNTVKMICFLPPIFLLFFFIGFHEKKQGFHDRIAGTFVVMEKTGGEKWQEERRWFILWAVIFLPLGIVFFLFV